MRDKGDQTRYRRVEWLASEVCAEHKSGSETVHAMNSLFQQEETDSVASGCVKRLQLTKNRAATLHSNRVLCLALATFAINTCRSPARLFEKGVKELISAGGGGG